MKILIADKFSEPHLERLRQLGCHVTYNPGVKSDDLPSLIAESQILVVRSKQVTAATLNASAQLSLVLRAGAGVDDVFRRADIVTLHVALVPQTRKLVNAARLALMKPNAILINTARGEVVDQAALRLALEQKKIRAGLDVFDPEPAEAAADFSDPILALPNL